MKHLRRWQVWRCKHCGITVEACGAKDVRHCCPRRDRRVVFFDEVIAHEPVAS